jgi:general secretion pathway protein G
MKSKRVWHLSRYALILLIILTAAAVPVYRRSVARAREAVLKNNLYTLRFTIHEYTSEKKKAPRTLDDLVQAGYLRAVPFDPMTGSNRTWRATELGSLEIHSGSDAKSLDGAPYSEW